MGVNFLKNIEILVISISCKFGLKLVLQIILLRAPRKKIFKTKWLKTVRRVGKKIKKFNISKKISVGKVYKGITLGVTCRLEVPPFK